MGAVIDEAMQGRVGSLRPRHGPISAAGSGRAPPIVDPTALRGRVSLGRHRRLRRPPRKPRRRPPKADCGPRTRKPYPRRSRGPPAPRSDQEEFTFGELESRGHFENTDRNLFEGQDLDVPNLPAPGIKIVL